MMDIHVSNGYEEISPPLVKEAHYMAGIAKIQEMIYFCWDHYIIPTAEVSWQIINSEIK